VGCDQAGNFPEWELTVQLFDEAFADSFDFDVLDATKIIPEERSSIRIRRAACARPDAG
jgi:catalase